MYRYVDIESKGWDARRVNRKEAKGMRSFLVLAVVLALMGATTAEAAGPGAPGVLCGNCDGSGYCQTQSVESTGQATGGTVWANYHWCTDWRGNIWGNYGWA